jgi:hypothetical protein
MPLVRKLALKISTEVVIWASPGSKEWAEGLAREVAFIESDWAALRWSLGSIRVLFDRREVPLASLDEVAAQFQKFTQRFIYSAFGLWFPIFRGPQSVFMLFRPKSEIAQLGSALIVFASISGLIFWLVERRRLKQQTTDEVLDNVLACALRYRAALKRVCSAIWIPALAFTSFWTGCMLEDGGIPSPPPYRTTYIVIRTTYIVVGICYVLALRIVQRVFQRRIERLDVLLAEKSGALSMDGVD